ncbi:MAG TPA: HD domain-containing protein [Candidatus Woesebacteria bacterium]|nr:HD domain-containing protein [Candidatus Woesebacteria bacterium]
MPIDLSLTQNCWDDLEKHITDGGFNREKIKKCFDFAEKAHSGQKRESGEPYITHPAWIAKVVMQLHIGEEAVLAALLHDCVEDTDTTLDKIAEEFGDEVALLVSGLTEVAKKTKGVEINQPNIELFRKFLFSSVNDVRVLILRLIDKLHNGLTIKYLSPERQLRYGKNILRVYGPVAEYVGLHFFKKIIEDIAFEIVYPKEADELRKMFEDNRKNEIKALALVNKDLIDLLKINNINGAIVEGRIKSLYSTFLKIQKKGKDRIKDRVALRILTENVADCYNILGLLHAKYQYLEDEFVDYIANPKPNGYRSIQTTVVWKEKLTVEIQIKTKDMHDFNEFGPASHIAYKLGTEVADGNHGMEWVKDLVQWQKNDKDIVNYRLQVLTNYIYVFTPKGDTIQLDTESTGLDFAYRIHTEVGDHCNGIKINGKMAKLDTELKTGDVVEVLMNKKLNVNKNWLEVAKNQWVKGHIRKMAKIDENNEI